MILRNCTVAELDPPRIEEGVDIRITGTRIIDTGKSLVGGSGEPERDMTGKIVMPGLVCGHNHFYSGLARGIIAPIVPITDFMSNLTNLWWRLDRALDEETLYYSGLVCCIDAVRSGCTAVIDHHASPSFIEGSLDVLKKTFEETGLRGVECYETTDRNGDAGTEAGIEENRRFALQAEGEREASCETRLVEALVGGHAAFTLGDKTLEALGHVVEETGRGFHVHISEDRFDAGAIDRLDRFGLVTARSVLAHGLYLTEGERNLMNIRDAVLVHNCRSNMNNGVGYNGNLDTMKTVSIGTDGIGSDVLAELSFAYFKHRDSGGSLSPGDFAGFLQNGNTVLNRCFDDRFGRIAAGFKADLTILDYDPPTPLVAGNLAGHLVFGVSSSDVESVMVNGKLIYEGRRFPVEIESLHREAREAAKTLWKKFASVPTMGEGV